MLLPMSAIEPMCRANLPPANQANDLRLVGSPTDSRLRLRRRWRRRGESIAMSKAIIDSARLWFARGAKSDLHERFAQVRKQRVPRGIWARIWALLSSQRGSHSAGLSWAPPR
jgi:hypothetical protein